MAANKQAASTAETAALLVEDRFRVLPSSPLPEFGGLACFAAEDRRGIAGEVVALRLPPGVPARARLPALLQTRHEAMLSPVAHGAAGPAYWVIVNAPPGPSLASLVTPWAGNALLTHVLRPIGRALDQLELNGLTHRAIRPGNLFFTPGMKSVVLGPACVGPAAMHQTAAFEPPYSAICTPVARGDGFIADDVYALGVLLLALWTGTMPLAGLDAREIIRLKLEHGSHAVLTNQIRLPRGFEEILRAMLSDDPLSRPTPAVLANLDSIHARRGGQRSAMRTPRPIAVGEQLAWNRRTLALLCAEAPGEATQLLRHGTIEQWLRRSPEDAGISAVIEELKRDELASGSRPKVGAPGEAGAMNDGNLMRLIALLDPLAPLFWRGCWMWPDALGPMLAGTMSQPASASSSDPGSLVGPLLLRGGFARWQASRVGRPEQGAPQVPARLLRVTGAEERQVLVPRLAYALNPYLGCASPKLAAELVASAAAMIATLEQLGGTPLLDGQMLAFLDARLEEAPSDLKDATSDDPALRELSMLARCQSLTRCGPLPRTAANLLSKLEFHLQDWPGLSRRERKRDQLRAAAASGDLEEMVRLLNNSSEREADEAARAAAIDQVEDIRAALLEQTQTTPARLESSRRAARDTASAAGLFCVMATLLYELLS